MARTETQKVLPLDPAVVIADDNVRFNLLPDKIERLALDIKRDGGVNMPVEVIKLPKNSENGY